MNKPLTSPEVEALLEALEAAWLDGKPMKHCLQRPDGSVVEIETPADVQVVETYKQ
jgi:hypothetical protein